MEGEGKAEVSLGGGAAPARKWQRCSITEEQAQTPRVGAPHLGAPRLGAPTAPGAAAPLAHLAQLGQAGSPCAMPRRPGQHWGRRAGPACEVLSAGKPLAWQARRAPRQSKPD